MYHAKTFLWISAFVSLTAMSYAQPSWTVQSNPLGDSALGKIQFVSPTEGWISQSYGHLLHTTNAGTSWQAVTPFPNDTVVCMTDPANSMWWVNPTHGWKINWFGTSLGDAHGAVIHKTTDGGTTWQKKVLSTAAGDMGFQIQFVNENIGWASIYNPSGSHITLTTMQTTNGGNNWDTVGTGGIFYFVDANNGWAIGPPKIYHTTNGGVEWTPQYVDTVVGKFNAIQFTDLNNGWVVGDSNKILKTTNGGITWIAITNTGIPHVFNSKGLFFLNANLGWIGSKIQNMPFSGDIGINLSTTNGGSTWTTSSFTGTENSDNAWSIFFVDPNNGWFTSDGGEIGHTTNGSSTEVRTSTSDQTPRSFSLQQNYPNPFNPSTTIRYQVPNTGNVRLDVYDVLGREVAVLVDEVKSAGLYTATFNAANLPSGVYFYRLHAGSFADTKKLILLK
jgi:photosystem II stability/assembly factor-like uncharacterized protein